VDGKSLEQQQQILAQESKTHKVDNSAKINDEIVVSDPIEKDSEEKEEDKEEDKDNDKEKGKDTVVELQNDNIEAENTLDSEVNSDSENADKAEPA